MLRFPEENGVSYGGEKYLQHKMDEYMDSKENLTKNGIRGLRREKRRE